MILTGKCKEGFIKYLDEVYNIYPYNSFNGVIKNALIIDFFDSVGIYIEIIIVDKKDFGLQIFKEEKSTPLFSIGSWNNRAESTTEAIKKANEIFNNR